MLRVEIALHGIDLPAKDYSGKSDPYLVFKHENVIIGRSEVVYNHLDPVWKPLTLKIKKEDGSVGTENIEILIECWDKDSILKSDDFIGMSRQTLADLLKPQHEILLLDASRPAGKLIIDKCTILENQKQGVLSMVNSALPGMRKLLG
jgi:Ca2+-dependent lipid-binding protein